MSDIFLASRLRERVTIESPERNADTYGGGDTTWAVVATVYASVKPLMGTAREVLTADQVSAIAGYRVSVRKRDDVDASMRILWNGRTLMIHSLHETEQTLEILTYEETL
jgi:SPP1 family predicted phage head-tail adaptor